MKEIDFTTKNFTYKELLDHLKNEIEIEIDKYKEHNIDDEQIYDIVNDNIQDITTKSFNKILNFITNECGEEDLDNESKKKIIDLYNNSGLIFDHQKYSEIDYSDKISKELCMFINIEDLLKNEGERHLNNLLNF